MIMEIFINANETRCVCHVKRVGDPSSLPTPVEKQRDSRLSTRNIFVMNAITRIFDAQRTVFN